MEQDQPKRRKCGPRVKTGCITCRIRRVKCDEGKPECQRCSSTGRKCDGYQSTQKANGQRSQQQQPATTTSVQVARRPSVVVASPLELFETPRDRQLFHFYCVQSASDLSVYLNSNFWHDMILQYSQYHEVVRQAVIAFGSSHLYALSLNQVTGSLEPDQGGIEPARRYDKAIRCLREYIESHAQPDPHAILICCALFFSCENARGNREAAWQHLENGLHIVNSIKGRRQNSIAKGGSKPDEKLQLVASHNRPKLKAKVKRVDLDDELVYVFSRLDVQATLCREARRPVLDLDEFSDLSLSEHSANTAAFKTITEAQRSLDFILNRLARFLSTSASPAHTLDSSAIDPSLSKIERNELNNLCSNWETRMQFFIAGQRLAVRQNLQQKHAPKLPDNPEWSMALQIQLLNLHHRCWWTLFRSHYNPSVFTMSPNPRAEEILDICDFLAFALPLRPSVAPAMTEADIAWKMISEIGVTAPLFVKAAKCTDRNVQRRAISQLTALRQSGSGLYNEAYLDLLINALLQQQRQPDPNFGFRSVVQDTLKPQPGQDTYPLRLLEQLDQYCQFGTGAPHDPAVIVTDLHATTPPGSVVADDASGELLGWSKASPSPPS